MTTQRWKEVSDQQKRTNAGTDHAQSLNLVNVEWNAVDVLVGKFATVESSPESPR